MAGSRKSANSRGKVRPGGGGDARERVLKEGQRPEVGPGHAGPMQRAMPRCAVAQPSVQNKGIRSNFTLAHACSSLLISGSEDSTRAVLCRGWAGGWSGPTQTTFTVQERLNSNNSSPTNLLVGPEPPRPLQAARRRIPVTPALSPRGRRISLNSGGKFPEYREGYLLTLKQSNPQWML